MKKFYFYGTDLNDNYQQLYVSEQEVKVGGFVIVDNGNLEPITVKVVKFVNELNAITSNECIDEIIAVVDMQDYLDKKRAEYSRRKLQDKMKTEIENIKMLETLKKYSTGSPAMKELYENFSALQDGNLPITESESE